MAEYAACYGGPPAPGDPWPLFLALVRRTQMFGARTRLAMRSAVEHAIASSFSGAQDPAERDELLRNAYPVKGRGTATFIQNRLRGNGDEGDA